MVFVVVDSDENDVKQVIEIIKDGFCDCAVKGFVDPMLAVQYVCNNKTDVVISNKCVKHLTNSVFVKVIRKQKPDVPIFMTSDTDEDFTFSRECNYDDFLIKPLSIETIRRAINKVRDVVY